MDTSVDNLHVDDIIIAIMGPTGVGKSNFIDVLVPRPDKRAGHKLSSCTNNIEITFLDHPPRRIVFVDLPAFDNTEKTEEDVLRIINDWLEMLAQQGTWLAGVLYMNRIDKDTTKPGLKDLRILRQIYAKTTTVQIRLVTTMWDELESKEIGERYEEALEESFEPFFRTLRYGTNGERRKALDQTSSRDAQPLRFLNTEDSAKSIVDALVNEATEKGGSEPGKMPSVDPQSRSPIRTGKSVRFFLESTTGKDQRPETAPPMVPAPSFSVDESQPPEARLRVLTSEIVRTRESRNAFGEALSSEEAQLMADYLNIALHRPDTVSRGNGCTPILDLLCKLAKSARVYPQCYILKGIKNESQPIRGGGFADVHKEAYKDQMICLKVIRIFQRDAERDRTLRSCMKEMLLWAHLSHDNVLPFYGVYYLDEAAQRPCLVSPWMEKGNLREYLTNQPDVPRIPLVQDITEGLLHLHGVSIAHGDLKAENILISENGRALLADFGLSTIAMTTTRGASGETRTGCTSCWAAPELVAESTEAVKPTRKSDIWSFGCLCLEIFTGKPPFYRCRQSHQAIAALQRGEKPHQPRWRDNICKQLDKWISRMMKDCWKANPRKRPTCEKIREILQVNANQRDERPKAPVSAMDKSAFWEDMRAQSDIKIDYERVEQIMRRFQNTYVDHLEQRARD